MSKIIDRIMRAGEGKILRELSKVVDQVNAFEPAISALSDEALRAKHGKACSTQGPDRLGQGGPSGDQIINNNNLRSSIPCANLSGEIR